jgi:DNA repair protein RadD
MKKPRDYQEHANVNLWNFIHSAHAYPKALLPPEVPSPLNPLVVEATGLGKSLNIAMIIRMLLHYYPATRILQTCHVKELVQGNHAELMDFWPMAPAGIYSAGLGVRDLRKQVTFASIMSVAKRAHAFQHIDFLIVDEAHTISDKDTATYAKFIAALRLVNPKLMVIGFTATPFRMTTGLLTDGDMFDEVVYDIGSGETFVWAVEQGYLIRPVPKNPGFELNSDTIGLQGGDFKNNEASDAMHEQDILERAVDLSIRMGVEQGRQNWLTFCQSIDDAETVADMFTYKGYPHEAVHSKRDDREEVLARWQAGELIGVTNKDILTTGINNPRIDMITMLRLTRSPGLWVQMVGRGTRPFWVDHVGHNGGPPLYDINTVEGRLNSILASPKQTCLVLDFVGNTKRLGPINYPRLPARRGAGTGGDMVRECPKCQTLCHISLTQCPECGYEYPPPERVTPSASEAAIVESKAIDLMAPMPEREIVVFGVHRMVCAHHQGRNGKPDTMRVDYFCGMRRFSQWVCLAHEEGSFPRRKAEEWWTGHSGQVPVPTDIDTAIELASDLVKPKFIKVWVNTKYPEILGTDFRGTRFELPPEIGGPPLQEPEPDPMERERKRQEEQVAKAQEHMASVMVDYDDEIPF